MCWSVDEDPLNAVVYVSRILVFCRKFGVPEDGGTWVRKSTILLGNILKSIVRHFDYVLLDTAAESETLSSVQYLCHS
jgi:hypothetical protein